MFGRNMYAVLDRKGQEQLKVELGPPRDEQKAAKSFTDWMNDNEVAYYLSMEHGFSESAEVDWMRNQNSKGEDRVWLVYVQDELIGSVGLHRIDAKNRMAEMGISLGNKKWWGKGIATAAEVLVTDFAFGNIVAGGLHKIFVRVFEGNGGSKKAIKRVGYREVGIRKAHLWRDGRWLDEWNGEMLQEDWFKTRSEMLESLGIKEINLFPGCEKIRQKR